MIFLSDMCACAESCVARSRVETATSRAFAPRRTGCWRSPLAATRPRTSRHRRSFHLQSLLLANVKHMHAEADVAAGSHCPRRPHPHACCRILSVMHRPFPLCGLRPAPRLQSRFQDRNVSSMFFLSGTLLRAAVHDRCIEYSEAAHDMCNALHSLGAEPVMIYRRCWRARRRRSHGAAPRPATCPRGRRRGFPRWPPRTRSCARCCARPAAAAVAAPRIGGGNKFPAAWHVALAAENADMRAMPRWRRPESSA